MLFYVLIGLCLSLAGVAGLQLMYMFYLDRLDKERKKRLHELETNAERLSSQLAEAESELEMKNDMLALLIPSLRTRKRGQM